MGRSRHAKDIQRRSHARSACERVPRASHAHTQDLLTRPKDSSLEDAIFPYPRYNALLMCAQDDVFVYEEILHKFEQATVLEEESQLSLGVCIGLDRRYPYVATPLGNMRAEFSAQLSKSDMAEVCVGDWLVIRHNSMHTMASILSICPRSATLKRWKRDSRGTHQILATHLGRLVYIYALAERGARPLEDIVRACVIAKQDHIEPIVVLTKADRVAQDVCVKLLNELCEVIPENVSISIISSKLYQQDRESAYLHELACGITGTVCPSHQIVWGVDALRAMLSPHSISMVLGASGAGKSSLTNALCGISAMDTQDVRARDDKGRHTTVARRMIQIKQAGILIDCPGIRNLSLLDEYQGLTSLYPEISHAATQCKFVDCTHTHEPSCAVHAFVDADNEQREARGSQAVIFAHLVQEMRQHQKTLDADIQPSYML